MAGFKGHLRGGVVCAVAAVGTMLYQEPFVSLETAGQQLLEITLMTTTIMIGSLLPDIDHPESFLGRRIRPISKAIHQLVGHRALTHSFIFIGGITYLLIKCGLTFMGIGLGIGMLGHILLDMLCLGDGVALLYPFYPRRIYLNLNVYRRRFYKKWMKGRKRQKRKKK